MSREGNLIKNTFILSLGTFLPKFVTVLVTPILTAQLTKAEYGQYDLVTTIVSLLLPAVTLQVSAGAFRFLIDKRKKQYDCSRIISTIYAFVLIISFIVGALYFLIVRDKVGNNGILICIYFILDILFVSTGQIVRGLGKNIMYSLSSILHAIVMVGSLVILTGFWGTHNYALTGTLLSMILATLAPLILLVCVGGIFPYIRWSSISLRQLRELLNYSWPMVPNNLSGWVLRLSDRLVITAFCGIEANALYAAACKMPSIFSSFQNTFMMAWQENASLASKDEDKDYYYSQMCSWVFNLLIGIMSMLICATPLIWKILIRGDYNEAYNQLPILYIGILFSCMSSTIGGIYIAHKKTRSVGITTTIAAIINLIVDLLLVKSIGIWAGSISTMISYAFLFVYRIIDVQKFQRVQFVLKKIVVGISIIAVMVFLCSLQNWVCNIINVFLSIITIIMFDRDIIRLAINKMKRKRRNSSTRNEYME